MKDVLGIDFGNVTLELRTVDLTDNDLFENHYSTLPAVEGVFEAVRKLNDEKFHGNMFIVSKATEWAQAKIRIWLEDNDFYNRTGMSPDNVFFCLERQEKEAICRTHGITHFVDDRLEVLSHLIGVVPNLFVFNPNPLEVDEFAQFLPSVTRVTTWEEVVKNILI